MNIKDLTDQQVLAATVWGEARGDGKAGMEAVACVIMNRAETPGWWGTDARSVCLHQYQFSCWNQDDPNRPKMLAVADHPDADFRIALDVAQRALAGRLEDSTAGATHYVMSNIADRTAWARGKKPVKVIGHHSFYKLGLGG